MGTYECLLQKTGSGVASSDHTDDILQPDADGVYQVFPAGEPIWKGARCVLDGAAGTDVDAAYADNGSDVLLPVQPYLHSQPATANYMRYASFESTQTAWAMNRWVRTATITVSRNVTGVDGVANNAATISCSTGAGYIYNGVYTNAEEPCTAIFWVKKTASATTYPAIGVEGNGHSTSLHSSEYIFNTDNGTFPAGRPSYHGAYSHAESELVGDWWRVLIHHDVMKSATYGYYPIIYPSAALASAPTVWDTTNAGSVIVGLVQFDVNKDISVGRRAGAIFNAGTAGITKTASDNTWDSANHSNTEGGYYLELDCPGGEVDILSNGGTAFLYTEYAASGTELVTNGDFTTDTTGWTGSNATLSKVTFDSRSNVLSVADNGGWSQAKQAITTVAGEAYVISGMRHNNNIASNGFTSVYDGDTTGSASTDEGYASDYVEPTEPAASSSWESYTLEFIAQSTTTTIAFGSTGADTAYFDDISVKKKEEQLVLNDGTNTISTPISTGEHQIGIAWETDTSEMDLCLNGTWYGSSDAYDGSFGTGDLSTEATIRELQGITGDLATSKAAIDVLMP